MLVVSVALVAGSVLGLRALLVTGEPTFSEAGAVALEDFVPVSPGGELVVTGEREGTFSLKGPVSGPTSFGLGGDDGRMFFEGQGASLVIRQFAFDGLEFFPDDGECTITPGRANADAGVAAVAIDCPDVRDIRDKATITVAGVAALPAAMVMTDVPPVGGEVRVGRSVWEIESALWLDPDSGFLESGYSLEMEAGENALHFSYADGVLRLSEVVWDGTATPVNADDCEIVPKESMALSPEVTLFEVAMSCPAVYVAGRGDNEISGSVVVERISPPRD